MVQRHYSGLERAGSVMALALFVVVLLLLMGVAVLSVGQTCRTVSVRTAHEVVARTAADAGLTKALWRMNERLQAGTWDWNSVIWEFRKQLPGCEGSYSFIVKKPSHFYGDAMPSGDEDLRALLQSISGKANEYVIMSIGRCGRVRQVVYGTARLRGPGDAGVLVLEKLELKADTLVDGRDSRDPTNPSPDVLLEIGTLSTAERQVVLNNGVTVDGNVLVGVDGDVGTVIVDHRARMGLAYPFPEEPSLPYVVPPALPDMRKRIFVKGQMLTIRPAESGMYRGIEMKRDKVPSILEISGGDVVLHITGDIDMGQGCEIRIDKGSTLRLYVDGDIRAGNSDGFNNLGTPPDFKLWGHWRGRAVSQKWELKAKSEFFGQLYAPNADVIAKAQADLYGAFTARSFQMMNGGNLYYDGALRDVSLGEDAVRFVLKRWHEM